MTEQPVEFSLRPFLRTVASGRTLSADDAEAVFGAFMAGRATPEEMAGFLVGLQARGIVAEEIAGGVRALRAAMVPVEAGAPEELVDTAGTGGGTVTTFNISTAAALVAAGAGARMAKHGNRSFTSRSGSADVLEALGVTIQLTPERMGEVLDEVGIVFMFAPLLHPAMRHVGPVRRALGVPTIMNLLGPLTNPAGARRQVVGVSDPDLLPLVVGGLQALGHAHALVVHGAPGMDELSPLGPTRVFELREGAVEESVVTPESVGLSSGLEESLAGGEPEDNAHLVRAVLAGERRGGARTAVLMNAGAALYVGGLEPDLRSGVRRAAESIDGGAALDTLERLVRATGAEAA
ncbi:MAG: anthranilate phosphoribosyltransferase [Gemmatimonadetes bacterium]|nr:anthranilate phosphoribosyltransferase [Gemmatimonadota bacterium]NNK64511.1 anthranilate phosphoribosyltransferase [Gemmatimonadota bacterium]